MRRLLLPPVGSFGVDFPQERDRFQCGNEISFLPLPLAEQQTEELAEIRSWACQDTNSGRVKPTQAARISSGASPGGTAMISTPTMASRILHLA